MKRSLMTMVLAGTAALFTTGALAGTAEVQWEDPDDFADIRAGQMTGQKRFEETVMADLSGFFQKGAERHLPEGQTLHVRISDVDLAGEVEFFHDNFPHGLRVIRNLYFPRLEFTWELRDADDRIVQTGEENIRDLRARYLAWHRDDEPMFYEERLVNEWFQNTFQDPANS